MSKTTFVAYTKVTAAFLNALQNIQFDGLDLDGHYPPITNAQLDPTSGSILNDWNTFKGALSVTGVSALVASYIGGSITLTDGSVATISNGSILIANNATNYIYINKSGAIETSTTYPTLAIPIAKIVTVGGVVSGSITDLRPRYRINPIAQAIKVFGGLGGEGSLNVTSGTTVISGEHYYSDINVSAGATLQITGSAYLYCSGNVTIAGTVTVTPTVKGGQGFFGALQNQAYPNTSGQGLGGGNSVNAPASPAYDFQTSPIGSGGASGWVIITASTGGGATITTPNGGNGGGNIIIEAAGTITVTGTITANGANGQGNTSVVQNPVSSYTAQISGGGGGSGGLILLKSLKSITATAAAVLSVRGGDGGNGFPNPTTQVSGGGGGGGYVALYSPSTNTTGATITLTGGASQYNTGFGSVSGGSFAGVGGSPGFAGSIGLLVLRPIIPV